MVCPLRIIVITVSVVVAITLALIALLSGEDDITQDWQRNEDGGIKGSGAGGGSDGSDDSVDTATDEGGKKGEKDDRTVWWKALDFANGRYLYRQYNKLRRVISSSPSSSGHDKML
jgi:hypothetical protein